MSEIILKGIPAAPGIARSSAFIMDKQEFHVPKRAIMEQEIPIEIARFEEALIKTREEICSIKDKIQQEMGGQHAKIFDAHLMVLEDRMLIEEVVKGIKNQKASAEYVFTRVLKKYLQAFGRIQDEYLKERKSDINDIGRRLLRHLTDEVKIHNLDDLSEELIIVAHDLSPSDAVSMFNKQIIAFVTDLGGRTSHTAIIAKSLGVPAVVGLKDATLKITNQDVIIVDGGKGRVIINPTLATLELYEREHTKIKELRDRLSDVKNLPAETLDGKRIGVYANLELAHELPSIEKSGAEGIGLYRTEFSFMNRSTLPSEEEQYQEYKKVVELLSTKPVTIRTLDLGGDKFISSVQIPKEMFPSLGARAIRFCLERPDIFKTQLRAILRASVHGQVRIMYPMISGIGELRQANTILEEAKNELRKENVKFVDQIPVGVMIEVPSAVMTADLLAKEANFFSIGTNDLIQYTLAVDRVSAKETLYEPAHPAILRMIKRTIDAGHNLSRDIGLCGEASSEAYLAMIFLGMGIDNLSMSASSVLSIKKLIRSVRLSDAQKLVNEVMTFSTGREIEEYMNAKLKDLVPHMFGTEEKK